jgi:hypothetical protein
MEVFTMKRLIGSFLCLMMLASCGLRDQLRAQRNQDKADDTRRDNDVKQDIDDKHQDQLSEVARKDMSVYRNYLQGLTGEYRGTYRSAAGTPADASGSGRIAVTVRIENDLGGPATVSKITVDQYRTLAAAMTLAVTVTEEPDGDEGLLRATCDQSGVKPDPGTGRIHFVCTTTGELTGRDYTFVLDHNADLISGTRSQIETLDVAIASPNAANFNGKLKRHSTSASVAPKSK